MLLGDIIARFDDEAVAMEALVGLGDAHAAAGRSELARDCWQQAYEAYTAVGLPAADRVRARLAAIGA